MRWIGTEVRDPPRYEGIIYVASFIREFELQIADKQRLLALDVALKEILARWWARHKDRIEDW